MDINPFSLEQDSSLAVANLYWHLLASKGNHPEALSSPSSVFV
jgi:hypothetical protein